MAGEQADLESARRFRQLVVVCFNISMGVGAGFLASVRGFDPEFIVKVDVYSFAAAVASVIFTTVTCRHVLPDPVKLAAMSPEELEASRRDFRRWLVIFGVVWAIITIVAGWVSLKEKSSDQFGDFMIGFALAIPPLIFVTWLFFKVKAFLDADSATVEDNSSGH